MTQLDMDLIADNYYLAQKSPNIVMGRNIQKFTKQTFVKKFMSALLWQNKERHCSRTNKKKQQKNHNPSF